ncbi:MAG TPA: hypothetical protein VFJ85_19095 [Acidimicrobiales bacterium]|nr:hypothetical protein [Acidimicrobiales bacterium]
MTAVEGAAPDSRLALGTTAAGTAVLLLLPLETTHNLTFPILVVSVVALGAFVVLERRRPRTSPRLLLAVAAGLAGLAVVGPPHGSHDVWSYAMYGRILGVHHANPYTHLPQAYPGDPLLPHVAPFWRHVASVYGPLFSAVAALVALVAGPHPLAARMLFQAIAAGAFLGVAVLLVRARTPPHLLAVVVLNPVIVVLGVNGGHNDLLVALALVGAAVAAGGDRALAAGLLVAGAVMVKVTALLAGLALAVWWWRRRRSASVIVLAAAGLPALAASLPFGLVAPWRPLSAASRHVAGPTPWRLVPAMNASGIEPRMLNVLASFSALALAVGACVLVVRRGCAAPTAMAAALTGFLLATPYILPWYLAWALPLAVLGGEGALVSVVAIDAAVIVLATHPRSGGVHDGLDRVLHVLYGTAQYVAVCAAAALVVTAARRSRPAPLRP